MQLLHQILPLVVVVIGCAVFLQPTAVDANNDQENDKLKEYQTHFELGILNHNYIGRVHAILNQIILSLVM